jgi:chaperone modulatory protein CbpM
MAAQRYALVLYCRKRQQLTLDALAERAGMHPSLVERFVECGVIEPIGWEGSTRIFDAAAVPRLLRVGRLRESLNVNVAGIAVILDLLDRFCALQRENEWLRQRR